MNSTQSPKTKSVTFTRRGVFYELWDDEAETVQKEFRLLKGKIKGRPCVGIVYYALGKFCDRLRASGYTVTILE